MKDEDEDDDQEEEEKNDNKRTLYNLIIFIIRSVNNIFSFCVLSY